MGHRWKPLRTELAHFRSVRAQHGTVHALLRRTRRALDLEDVTRGRVDLMSEQISELDAQLRRGADQLAGLRSDLHSEGERVADLHGEVARVGARTLTNERIFAVTSWVADATVNPEVLVSVVLPTLGARRELLVRAVESVKAQLYPNWELLVVTSDPSRLADLGDDPRIRVLTTDQEGVAAARNRALDAARGELVAYCDDDNLMAPLWLKAVVWAADTHPDADVFYGAQIIESPERVSPVHVDPSLTFVPFERRFLLLMNCIDQGALAHRRALPEARFDETLDACVDWDLVIRLSSTHEPVAIPVVASHYSTTAPDRLSARDNPRDLMTEVRRRAWASSQLRVLAYNSMFPLISEAYIGDEVEALVQHGAEAAFCTAYPRSAPMPWKYPLYFDLARAVSEFRPDVVLVHWAVFAEERLAELEGLGIPFALRVHSFDARPDLIARVQQSPACCGVWAFRPVADEAAGVHPLPTLFTSHELMPAPAAQRDLVMSVSAGLPKKDWDVLLDALLELPELDRRIVTGLTEGHTDLPTRLVERVQQHRQPPLVQVNLTRDQVFTLLARAAAFIYTLAPDARFGNPMSIVEAMCAGACIIAPDRPEAQSMIGSGFRGYRTSTDIVAHVHEIFAGGPVIEAEREANRQWAREQFCDPAYAKRFSSELTDAVADWYLSRLP